MLLGCGSPPPPPPPELWLLTVSTAAHTSSRCSWTRARHSRATSARQLRAKGSRSVWPGPSEALPLPSPGLRPAWWSEVPPAYPAPTCLPFKVLTISPPLVS